MEKQKLKPKAVPLPEKVIRNGKVAVLYSPGFGAGWSTWGTVHQDFLLFDKGLVDLCKKEAHESEVKEYLDSALDDKTPYLGGWGDVRIEWIPEGTLFKVNEYDGSESIEFSGHDGWTTA